MTSLDQLETARDLLERTATWIDEHGWLNNGGVGDNGERCLLNSIGRVGFYPCNVADIAYNALAAVIRQRFSVLADSRGILARVEIIIYWNDERCTGAQDATAVLRDAVKHITGLIEKGSCAPALSPIGS